MKSEKGFTLVELLVGVAVIVILTLVLLPSWKGGEGSLALERTASKISQDIKRTAELALSAKPFSCGSGSISGYGIFFDSAVPASYLIFADCNGNRKYDAGTDGVAETMQIESAVRIQAAVPSALSISFVPPDPLVSIKNATGGDSATAQITLALVSDSSQTRVITVNARGVESIQ